MTADIAAATAIGLLPRRPRLLALGEPAHGEEDLLGLRNDLFRQLVEQEGYRTIAIESDCLRGLIVDEYVRSGADAFDDVMERGFSHEWGAFPGNRELVRWMRSYNDGRSPAEQVRFAGFDGPLEITGAASPRAALLGLHAYLAARVSADLMPCTAEVADGLLGADDPWPDPAAMTDPSRSVGRTPEAAQLRLIADDLVALFDAEAPHLLATSTPEEWERARLHGRTAAGLLSYHYWMADTSPGRLTRLVGQRDAMMAANLLALTSPGPARGGGSSASRGPARAGGSFPSPGPVLASGHNGHFQRNTSSMRLGADLVEWWSAGAIAAVTLGEEYAHLALAVGTIHHRGVDIPAPDTIEGQLYARPEQQQLLDPRHLDGTAATRVSPWFGYAPLDPAHLAEVDGVLFVKDAHDFVKDAHDS